MPLIGCQALNLEPQDIANSTVACMSVARTIAATHCNADDAEDNDDGDDDADNDNEYLTPTQCILALAKPAAV